MEKNEERKKATANRTIEVARRKFEDRLDGWLQGAVTIRYGLSLTETSWSQVSIMFEEIVKGLRKKEQKRRDFDILMANLLCNALTKRGMRPLQISMDDGDYGADKRLSGFFPKLVRKLHAMGIIRLKKGFNFGGTGRYTRIWFQWETISGLFGPGLGPLEGLVDWKPPELVQLRERLTKEEKRQGKRPGPIAYKPTAFTLNMERKIDKVNTANRRHRVEFPLRPKEKSVLNTDLFAVFHNESFKEGGRLYTSGWFGYQRLSEEERAEILIDGEPTKELDYSGLHPRLLYAREGIKYPIDVDPYAAVSDDPVLRDKVLKGVLLAMLNSESEIAAERSGNYQRHLKHEVHKLLKRKRLSVREIIARLKAAHQPIAHYFFTVAGLTIMREDSTIALKILLHFAKKNICCLAIHDSFIVAERYQKELREVMEKTYRDHTKGFECPIK